MCTIWKAAQQASATLRLALMSSLLPTIVGVEMRKRGMSTPVSTHVAVPTGIVPP
jgi:hypothetical protein